MNKTHVLILSPSLKIEDNVSGISSITKTLIDLNDEVQYTSFIVGKKDSQKRNLIWFLQLIILPFRFIYTLLKNHIDKIHFNIGFEPLSLYRDFLLFIIAKIFKTPIILHIHGGRFVLKRAKSLMIYHIIKYMINSSDKIITLSTAEEKALKNNYSFSGKDIMILPNSVYFSKPIELNSKNFNNTITILFLGRIDLNKGLDTIINVSKLLEFHNIDFRFIVCGDGPQKNDFLKKCFSLIGEKLNYKGIVYGEIKYDILNQSHIFLLPSRFEGLPMSLLETMFSYIVPIVSPVGAIPEIITSNYNGFLTSNISKIEITIKELNNNRDLLKKIATNAANSIRNNYSIQQYIKKLNNIYYEQ